MQLLELYKYYLSKNLILSLEEAKYKLFEVYSIMLNQKYKTLYTSAKRLTIEEREYLNEILLSIRNATSIYDLETIINNICRFEQCLKYKKKHINTNTYLLSNIDKVKNKIELEHIELNDVYEKKHSNIIKKYVR